MHAIIAFLVGKNSLTVLWYAFYITFMTAITGFYVGFALWFIQLVLYVNARIDDLLLLLNNINASEIGTQILGLLSCIGVTDGINAGLPILMTAVSTVLFLFVYRYMIDFYFFMNSVVRGLKP